jgi:hypothetical protein
MPTGTIARCGGAASGYFQQAVNISPGNLRAYYGLGELATPFADTAGWVNGPADMSWHAGAIPWTAGVAGFLPGSQDDGAVQSNGSGPAAQLANTAITAMWTGVKAAFSVSALFKPTATGNTFRGGIFSNQSYVAGSPSHEEGWSLEEFASGGVLQARLTRAVSGATISTAFTMTAGVAYDIMGTYDGATNRLYVNGALVDSQADARIQLSDAAGAPTLFDITTSGAVDAGAYGVVDTIAFWGAVLTPTQVATLAAAAGF